MKYRLKKGFSLVELLVAIGLMVVLMSIMALITQSAQKMYESSKIRTELISNGRTALDIIDRDLANVVPLTNDPQHYVFQIRSKPFDDTASPEENQYCNIVAPPTPPSTTAPYKDTDAVETDFVLSFFAATSYHDTTTGNREYRICRIRYYLRRRLHNDDGLERPGAYLVRRVEPYHFGSTGDIIWDIPSEEDICPYVRGVRIRYYQRDTSMNAATKDIKLIEAREAADPKPDTTIPLWLPTEKCVSFQMQLMGDWENKTKPFTMLHFLPPALEIELHVVDSRAQCYRMMRRNYTIDIAPTVVPVK